MLDVHVAVSIGRALADEGHDVVRASDAHADWSDARLLAFAVDERRIVVTEDRDFSDMIYRDGACPPPAVLYLRSDAASQPMLVERVLMVLSNTDFDGQMVVLGRDRIRYRPLPEQSDNG